MLIHSIIRFIYVMMQSHNEYSVKATDEFGPPSFS